MRRRREVPRRPGGTPVREAVLPPSAGRAELLVRVALALTGVAALLVGVVRAAEDLLPRWWYVLRWAAGGLLVHDVLLAPVALLLGFVVLRRVPASWHDPLRGALLGFATAAVLTVPLLLSPARRYNDTILPTPGWVSIGVAVLVPLAGALLAHRLDRSRRRRDHLSQTG